MLSPESRGDLLSLAESLGFIVTRQGTYHGEPSVRDFLHALAAAYQTNPTAVTDALSAIGVIKKAE